MSETKKNYMKKCSARIFVVSDYKKTNKHDPETVAENNEDTSKDNSIHKKPLQYCVFIAGFPFTAYSK